MDKRKAILDATAKLINEHGLQNTPMSMIAKAADVGAGTIYRHFANKDELVVAVYTSLLADLDRVLSDLIDMESLYTGPVKVRFFLYWRKFFEYHQAHPEQTNLLVYLGMSPYIKELIKDIPNQSTEVFYKILMDGQAELLIKSNVEIEVLIKYILGGMTNIARQNEGRLSDEMVERIIQMAWDGIKA